MKMSSASAFSIRLREATRAVHTSAEKTTFIRGFLRGTASTENYLRLLASLHPVYAAMEEETVRLAPDVPVVARLHFPELFRADALARDLVFLAGPDWRSRIAQMPASVAYVGRIRLIARSEPERLVGHLYTRYLGDLSGGQILARIAQRSLGLSRGAGLDFYDFSEVADIAAMKALFRARLDELDTLCPHKSASVTAEAIQAFQHNIAIFDALEGNGLLSFMRNLPLPWMRAAKFVAPVWPAATAHAR